MSKTMSSNPASISEQLEERTMSATTATQPAPASTTPAKGFKLRCPFCGSADSIIRLDLGNLEEFFCTENECEFTTADVREIIGSWSAVLNWIGQAPPLTE